MYNLYNIKFEKFKREIGIDLVFGFLLEILGRDTFSGPKFQFDQGDKCVQSRIPSSLGMFGQQEILCPSDSTCSGGRYTHEISVGQALFDADDT